MENKIGKVLLLLALAGTACEDCREKQIALYIPIATAGAGVVLHLLYREMTLENILLGATVGGMLILIAWISRGSVGVGDGIMLTVSGIFLGFWENIVLFMTALGMVSMTALCLIVIKRKERNYRLPFLPFLLAAYLFLLI
ncbi:MAG: type IV prepilin peptidase [Clostridiales bacterium]|nr:type IV prepilin peptidase [Roseburia sp.]MDD7636109.1 type IV prepilin peptidase [Clostridiales bacterium]MDY4112228.1 type IV prepilin peptidase [Roseburia sp.]